MKKRVTFLAALLVAACFGATVAMAEGSAKVTAQSGLNMRQGPGINYNVVTVLNNGATVNVVTPDDGNGWTYVTSGKNAGWVATKYLSGSAATTQAPSWRGSAVNCTVKSDANIRRGPGTDFGVLGVVPAGVGRACGFVRKRMAGAEHRVQLPDNGHPRPRAAPKRADSSASTSAGRAGRESSISWRATICATWEYSSHTRQPAASRQDRKSTRLNSSHT